jgi:hypothetical protein
MFSRLVLARVSACAILSAAVASVSAAGIVGFEEDFALAPDRTAAIKQLIPGTPDHYYYTALNLQNQGKLDEVDKTLEGWIKQHGRTSQVTEIEHRQALLRYSIAPQQTLTYLTSKLNLYFNHEKETQTRDAALASELKPADFTLAAWKERAFNDNHETLNGFEDAGLDWLARNDQDLQPRRLHELLSRMTRPDVPGLVPLIVKDLQSSYNSGFGSLTIHKNLLLAQLEELLKAIPTLINDSNFFQAYLLRLAPAAGVDWQHDKVEHAAYLKRLQAFAAKLPPSFNSFKAHVLYQQLVFDRKNGNYDKTKLIEYLKLPRPVFYINPKYMEQRQQRDNPVDMNADFATALRPINNDEPLVRSYLMALLADVNNTDDFAPYLESRYLRYAFAEAKLTAGVGEAEKWYALMDPTAVQALKDRVDLDFSYTNREDFKQDDAVSLEVNVKNIKTLIMKVYEINAANYYKTYGREVSTDINLDGLVANEEQTLEQTDPPMKRRSVKLDLPKINKPGTYVVEFIGNGKSSRALIRKGQLHSVVRYAAAGHVLTILDESEKVVKNASVWMANHQYMANEDGNIVLPYSTAGVSRTQIVITAGNIASFDHFEMRGETYNLKAGIHIDREALLKYGTATAIIRPSLFLNGVQVSPKLLKEVVLTVTSVDADGTSTSKEITDFALFDDKESTFDFAVPDRLRSISFTLRAKVDVMTTGGKADVGASKTFSVNGIDSTQKVEDLHLTKIDGVYYIDVLGKTGESKSDRPVNLAIKHKYFTRAYNTTLKTDAKGRIKLGDLAGVDTITANGPESGHVWNPGENERPYSPVIHAGENEPLNIPYMGSDKVASPASFSLIEVRENGAFVADRFDALTVKDGFLQIKGLPAGDYNLMMKDSPNTFVIHVIKGNEIPGWIVSGNRSLELANRNPLQIADVAPAADKVTIKLANISKDARVHVFATRFAPQFDALSNLDTDTIPRLRIFYRSPDRSSYESGRIIGDEYRYILDRKYASKFPGVMLDRPGVLLNPWAIRVTDTGLQAAHGGTNFEEAAKGAGYSSVAGGGKARRGEPAQGVLSPNLDFLAEPTAQFINLKPDADGNITIDRAKIGMHNELHIVAIDAVSTVYREISLPQPELAVRDLRLLSPLDGTKHFTEQKQITLLAKGDTVATTGAEANLEVYDTVGKVYRLYSTLRPDATLAEFSFILTWPTLAPEKKRELYSKYACHELNFFIARRDPAFFDSVVKSYLKNKRDKTFMDNYLLENNLNGYMDAWAYNQLNTVERVLLAQRINGEGPKAARAIKDRFDLTPPNIEQFNFLFATAVQGGDLENAGRLLPAKAPAPTQKPGGFNQPGRQGGAGGGRRDQGNGLAAGAMTEGELSADMDAPESAAPRPVVAPTTPAAPPADFGLKKDGAGKIALQQQQLKEAQKRLSDSLSVVSDDNFAEAMREEALDREKNKDAVRQLYRKVDKTSEWVENNYYRLPIQTQVASLVGVNGLWKDYAAAIAKDTKGAGFVTKNLAQPTSNFTEMMFALSVIDLPFEAPKHERKQDGDKLTLTAAGAAVAFHKEIKEAEVAPEKTPILVSQNYFRLTDRYTYVDNERTDKYVTDEFLTHVVYGCQVVITNPTSSRQKLDALMQIPAGAMPLANAQSTKGLHVELQPYETRSVEYLFYFPSVGEYAHYPVQVAKNEKFVAGAAASKLKVVATPSKVDTTSWDYITQNGTADEVIRFLNDNNIERLNLEKIAWRMRDEAFYKRVIPLLSERHIYNNTLWSYAIKQNDAPAIKEFLQHQPGFVNQCGAYLNSPLLAINPVTRMTYEHMEYAPLINARAHRLSKDRVIVNDRFYQQYERTLAVLRYHPSLNDEDKLAVTYYLLLQDRVDEGLAMFEKIEPKNLTETIQYDYFKAYTAFYTENPAMAQPIVDRYKNFPVDRWRKLFANVGAQLDELGGKATNIVNKEDRNQQQNQLASTEPTFEFRVDAKQVTMNYKNLQSVKVNYYLMDLELLFSENPFLAAGGGGRFSLIRPNLTTDVQLDPAKGTLSFNVPEKFLTSNVMVEIVGAGTTKSQAYYANSLSVALAENYGTLTVTSQATGKPLPKAYVKVYAKTGSGQSKFYKDGYTDLRGKFEYASLSTNELDGVDKFSLLVMTDSDGAIVREAAPPKQ